MRLKRLSTASLQTSKRRLMGTMRKSSHLFNPPDALRSNMADAAVAWEDEVEIMTDTMPILRF